MSIDAILKEIMTTAWHPRRVDGASAKLGVFGIGVNSTTYEDATATIIDAATSRRSLAVTALATHGLMEAVSDPEFGRVVNSIDLVTPDGQPVRWALNRLAAAGLDDRVYGPTLTLRVCGEAERRGLSVYLFGSTAETCDRLVDSLHARFAGLEIAGVQPDRFREATPEEDRDDIARIVASGANIVLVGRGCPRQERWVEAHRGAIPAPMLAVGAAFDYLSGVLPAPPQWMQRAGLEWLYRLCREPRRLWRRYLVTNTQFIIRFSAELVAAWRSKRQPAHCRATRSTAWRQRGSGAGPTVPRRPGASAHTPRPRRRC